MTLGENKKKTGEVHQPGVEKDGCRSRGKQSKQSEEPGARTNEIGRKKMVEERNFEGTDDV